MRSKIPFRRGSRFRTFGRRLVSILQMLALVVASVLIWPILAGADEHNETDFFVDPGGSRTLHCGFTGQQAHVEETVYCRMRVGNGSPVDASYYLFIKEESFAVTRCPDQGAPGVHDDFDFDTGDCANGAARIDVPKSDPRWDRFVGFWAFSVTTRPMIMRSVPEDRDVRYDERFRENCPKRSLADYNGGEGFMDESRMCSMGLIRSISGLRAFADSGEPAYERQYLLGMTLRDDLTDQTEFRGWGLEFDYVVRAKIPVEDPCPTARVNGLCAALVFQRT